MTACRNFYNAYGEPMIHACFPEYEKRIAVGLAGEGSDCFGFDDEISQDHDYEVGFCMWLTEEDYRQIGAKLQMEYEKLLERQGIEHIPGRRGVFRIDGFYEAFLGIRRNSENQFLMTRKDWMAVKEERLALCANGEIFRDDSGIFTSIRNKIKMYYPKEIWNCRLAEQLHLFSQNGQYNYARMMARKDYVTAQICMAQAVKAAMSVAYLLNRVYAPYYKWMKKGLENLKYLSDIMPVLEELAVTANQETAWENVEYRNYVINREDKKVLLFEELAGMILEELNRQGIVKGENPFLDVYCMEIASRGMEHE